MQKKIIRIIGRNGMVYEERMTEEDFALFLQLVNDAVETRLGVAFDEWTIQVVEPLEQAPYEQERQNAASDATGRVL